jgi:uncharacterized repeat protein (TIGR03809 family)
MTQRADLKRGRDIVARWCNLAEQRLEHLTELFESGRWRRYHTELAFLQNIQEAKTAVETWRDLLREASLDPSEVVALRLHAARSAPPRDNRLLEPAPRLQPQIAPIAVAPPRDIPGDVLIALESQLVASDEAPSAPDIPDLDDIRLPPLDLEGMKRRYPLLRNAL